jgi:hypothetical protein
MNLILHRLFGAAILGRARPMQAATLTVSTEAPIPGGNDICNFGGFAEIAGSTL